MKNVGSDELDGKVGRIYMPSQDVGSMALHKMKVHDSSTATHASHLCTQSAIPICHTHARHTEGSLVEGPCQ